MKSSKPNKPSQKDRPVPFLSLQNCIIGMIIIAAIVTLVVLKNRLNPLPPAQTVSSTPSTNAAPIAAQAKPDFHKLKGKWLRPDGGYIIEIKSVDDSGKLDASYLNPRPIHVAKAEATQDGGTMKVFIELQDVNYPGSTYTLTYIPARDLLAGIYFQALQRQSYEVYFERTQ
ncbi:MAG TPA: hypothetical protein VFZ59_26035 [Verrucomicrobiae bacterium]|nr:hypothetical protein [Verrucomicrobiae bacterium]